MKRYELLDKVSTFITTSIAFNFQFHLLLPNKLIFVVLMIILNFSFLYITGAYGQAVLYRRKEDESLVILKKINILDLNKTERQNVVTEIKILSMLDHPHIISYYDNFEEDGVIMIEMEFADGG